VLSQGGLLGPVGGRDRVRPVGAGGRGVGEPTEVNANCFARLLGGRMSLDEAGQRLLLSREVAGTNETPAAWPAPEGAAQGPFRGLDVSG
jgi:hypothetical protein